MRTALLVILTVAVAVCALPVMAARPDGLPPQLPTAAGGDGVGSVRRFDFRTPSDIVLIAQQEIEYNSLLDDRSSMAPSFKNTTVLTPVFVESLDDAYPSYYIVQFMKNNKISAIAIVAVFGKQAEFMEAYGLNPNITTSVYPPIVEDEAKGIAAANGKAVGKNKGKLVFKFSEECGGPAMPAWDFGNGVRVSMNGKVFGDFTPEGKIKKD